MSVDAALLAITKKNLWTIIDKFLSDGETTLDNFQDAITYATGRLEAAIQQKFGDVLGDATQSLYNYYENGTYGIETNHFVLSGAPDNLFPAVFNMNIEMATPKIVEVIVSAPIGTVVSVGGTPVKTITPKYDLPEAWNMGMPMMLNSGIARIPFDRYLTGAIQAGCTIQGVPGTEAIIHYVGWQRD